MFDDEEINIDPLTNFRLDVTSDDLNVQINALKKLPILATILNETTVREELVPLLEAILDRPFCHDEVMLTLAQEINKLVPFIGGWSNAHLLLDMYEKLASADDTHVREQTVTSLRLFSEGLDENQIIFNFIPLIFKLGESDWFSCKSSSVTLCSIIYSRTPIEQRSTIITLIRQFCQDDSPTVRRASASNLPTFIEVVELELLKNKFIPVFDNLAKDDQDSIRLLCVPVGIALAKRLTTKEVEENVLTTLMLFSNDSSWKVRYQFAYQINEIQSVIGPLITQSKLADIFKALARDTEARVREIVAHNIVHYCYILQQYFDSSENHSDVLNPAIIEDFIPLITELANDPNEEVKKELYTVLHSLSNLLGATYAKQYVLPIITSNFATQSANAKEIIITNLNNLIAIIGVDDVTESAQKIMLDLLNTRQSIWRSKRNLIVTLSHMAKFSTRHYFDQNFKDIYVQLLNDEIFSVRRTAPIILPLLAKKFSSAWTREFLKEHIFTMAENQNYLFRLTSLFHIDELVNPYLNVSAKYSTNSTKELFGIPKEMFLTGTELQKLRSAHIIYSILSNLLNVQEELNKDWVKALLQLYPGDSYYNDDVISYSEETLDDLKNDDNYHKIIAITNIEMENETEKTFLETILLLLPEILKLINYLRCDKIDNVKIRAARTLAKIIGLIDDIEREIQQDWIYDAIRYIHPENELLNKIETVTKKFPTAIGKNNSVNELPKENVDAHELNKINSEEVVTIDYKPEEENLIASDGQVFNLEEDKPDCTTEL